MKELEMAHSNTAKEARRPLGKGNRTTEAANRFALPEPWMVNAYFFDPGRLNAEGKLVVEEYLNRMPRLKQAYEVSVRRDQVLRERAHEFIPD